MRRLSPQTYARLTAAVAWAVGLIIVTGGAVRLTGSGLGCPDWPTCTQNRLVAQWDYHQMVEFVNRVVTGAVSIAVILAVLGAWFRVPRRRDLIVLACGLVAGVIGQIVLGGVTVLFDLAPPFVMAHFLLSLAILATAVVLHHRASRPDTAPRPAVSSDVVYLGRVLLIAVGVVVFTGTVVTGAGPHGGDTRAKRLPFLPTDVARVHGSSVMIFLGLVLVTMYLLRRDGGAPDAMRRATVLLAAIVAQAAVGYTQYFTGVPPLLVGIHIAGAATVWAATIRFHLGLFVRPAESEKLEAWHSPSSRKPAPRPSRSNDLTPAARPATTSALTDPGWSSSGTIPST